MKCPGKSIFALLIGAACLIFVPAVAALYPLDDPEDADGRPTFTFKEDVSLVTMDVIVLDKKGNFIRDLKPGDFRIVENDKEQEIVTFDIQVLDELTGAAEGYDEDFSAAPATHEQVPAEIPRSIVLLFDTFNTPLSEAHSFRLAQRAAVSFVKDEAFPSDMISVMNLSRTVKVAQDFTTDHEKVIRAIESIFPGSGASVDDLGFAVAGELTGDMGAGIGDAGGGAISGLAVETGSTGSGVDPFSSDTSAFGKGGDTALELEQRFSTKAILKTLALLGKSLKPIKGRKTILYFSRGFPIGNKYIHYYLEEAADRLNDANATIYSFDIGNVLSTMADASVDPLETRHGSTGSATDRYARQDSLNALAIDTGGRFYPVAEQHLEKKLKKANKETSNYYLLGYYSNAAKKGGKFNRVRVTCTRPGTKVITRKGYFTPEKFKDLDDEERRMMLVEALYFTNYKRELPMSAEIAFFRDHDDAILAPVTINVPGSQLIGSGDIRHETRLEIIATIYGADGSIHDLIHKTVKMKLKYEYRHLSENDIKYVDVLRLEKEATRLKVIVRDNFTGAMVARDIDIDIPGIFKGGLFTSNLVFVNPSDDAFVIAKRILEKRGIITVSEKQKKKEEKSPRPVTRLPLMLNGKILTPREGQSFGTDENGYIFFEMAGLGVSSEDQLPEVFVSYRVVNEETGESVQAKVSRLTSNYDSNEGLKVLSYLSMKGLQAGRYRLVAQASDLITGMVDTQEGLFEIN